MGLLQMPGDGDIAAMSLDNINLVQIIDDTHIKITFKRKDSLGNTSVKMWFDSKKIRDKWVKKIIRASRKHK